MSGVIADAAVQSEARKIILPKYGIRKFKAKNFELATLRHLCLRPKEIDYDSVTCNPEKT